MLPCSGPAPASSLAVMPWLPVPFYTSLILLRQITPQKLRLEQGNWGQQKVREESEKASMSDF